jgi:hypothetical protein
VLELKKRVEIIADAELTNLSPRSAIVEIDSADGSHFKILLDRMPGRRTIRFPPRGGRKFLLLSVPARRETFSSRGRVGARLENLTDGGAYCPVGFVNCFTWSFKNWCFPFTVKMLSPRRTKDDYYRKA